MPRVWIFTNWPILCGEYEKAKASFIVRNRPSDGSPRAVGNGLAIVEKD